MTNELKPCPFCGEKACIEVFDSHMNFPKFRAECSTCEINLRLKQTRDDAIEAWNTRQPAFDWKPIEHIYDDSSITPDTNLIFCDTRITGLFDHYRANRFIDYSGKITSKRLIKDYTHYALLTPPQTNQSNK